jgi:hypothetical protein
MTPPKNRTLAAVNKVIRSVPNLSAIGQARAEMARGLARQLDSAYGSTSGAMAQSLSPINKRLEALLIEIQNENTGTDDFLASIFRDDETGEDVRTRLTAKKAANAAKIAKNHEDDDEPAVPAKTVNRGIYPGCPQENRDDAYNETSREYATDWHEQMAKIRARNASA